MSYYQRHLFVCLNQRANGEACCADHDAQAAFDHCKARVKQLGLAGKGGVRVNKAGCLDRCAGGPEGLVGDAGGPAGAALDDDGAAERDQLLHGVRRGRHARLLRDFGRHGDAHRFSPHPG